VTRSPVQLIVMEQLAALEKERSKRKKRRADEN
jgi:hypothetical protein